MTYTIIGAGVLGAVLLGGFVVWLALRYARKLGASQAVAKGQEKVIDNVDKARRAIHDLDSDPNRRDSVRRRHTRD